MYSASPALKLFFYLSRLLSMNIVTFSVKEFTHTCIGFRCDVQDVYWLRQRGKCVGDDTMMTRFTPRECRIPASEIGKVEWKGAHASIQRCILVPVYIDRDFENVNTIYIHAQKLAYVLPWKTFTYAPRLGGEQALILAHIGCENCELIDVGTSGRGTHICICVFVFVCVACLHTYLHI